MDADARDALRKALHAKVQSSFLFGLLTYVDAYQESNSLGGLRTANQSSGKKEMLISYEHIPLTIENESKLTTKTLLQTLKRKCPLLKKRGKACYFYNTYFV